MTQGRAPSVIEQLRREEEEEDRMLPLLQSGENEEVAGVGDAQGEEAEDDRVTDVDYSEGEDEDLPFPTLLSYKAGPVDDGSIPGYENLPRLLPDALMAHSDRWIRYKVIPPKRGALTKSLSQQSHHSVIRKLNEEHGINTRMKTHGGRHAGVVEAVSLNISDGDIKRGGRWNAAQGNLGGFYMPRLPATFALRMGGHSVNDHGNFKFCLGRNRHTPDIKYQKFIFPWIERVVGEDGSELNKWWRKQCEFEMGEIDVKRSKYGGFKDESDYANNLPALVAQAKERRASDKSDDPMLVRFGDPDVKLGGFLRLLVRCRRIILQDAAWLLHVAKRKDQGISPILRHEIFQQTWFEDFQQLVIGGIQENKDPELQDILEHFGSAVAEAYNQNTSILNNLRRDHEYAQQQNAQKLEKLQQQNEKLREQNEKLHEQNEKIHQRLDSIERALQFHFHNTAQIPSGLNGHFGMQQQWQQLQMQQQRQQQQSQQSIQLERLVQDRDEFVRDREQEQRRINEEQRRMPERAASMTILSAEEINCVVPGTAPTSSPSVERTWGQESSSTRKGPSNPRPPNPKQVAFKIFDPNKAAKKNNKHI